MTDVAHAHDLQEAPPAPTGWHRWTAPGWLRVLWVTPLFFLLGIGIVLLYRWLADWQPFWKGSVITTVELVTTPLGFLVGLGGFDYLAYYGSGRPRARRITPATARGRGATTSASTRITR